LNRGSHGAVNRVGGGSLSGVEKDLYPAVKEALTAYLRQGDDPIAIMLEVTADGFSESAKALLPDNVLWLLYSKEARPDLFGHIGPDCTQASNS